MSPSAREKVISALHPSRMQPYLEAADQNQKAALDLYRWHSNLTAAVQAVLGMTEVILRNAMDRELQAWNARQLGAEKSWLLEDPAAPLRSLSSGKRLQALAWATKEQERRLPAHHRYGQPVCHDDVLAQVTFGMWKDLLPNHERNAGINRGNSNRARMWEEALQDAFPLVEDPTGEKTYWRVRRLHHLRNRVSHMEPLLNVDVSNEVHQAFDLVRSIDVDVSQWLAGASHVSEVLKRRPSPRGQKGRA